MGLFTTSLLLVAILVQCVYFTSATYYCSSPDPLQYGSISPQERSYSVGATIDFKCNEGYVLVGRKWTVCIYNAKTRSVSWAHPNPVCKPITCSDLENPQYGYVNVASNRVGGKAHYRCNEGYTLKGLDRRRCLVSGDWRGEAPVCIPVTCPDLEDPQYGSVKILSNRVGGKAVYTCKDGFVLKGQSPRKCLITGYWSGEAPVCIPVTCPYLEDPQYGSVKILSNRVGGKAVYTCKDGFVLKGQSPRKCLITGYWSGEAPVCIPVTCPYLEDPQYGSVKILSNRVGGKAVYTCKDGFVLKGQSPRKCLITGYWSGEAPVCIPVTCPYLEDPQYGSVKILSNRVGGKAVYTCKDGFVLKGQSPRKCLITGYWSGEAPVCIPVTCPYLEDPQYGSVRILSNRVGGKAVYTCKDGFVLKGQSPRKCLITGYWSGEAPVCIPVTCPDLEDPQYGSVKILSNRVGGKAVYTCKDGFVLKGQSPRKCLITGYWSGEAPVCIPVTCPYLEDPQYGSVRILSNRVGGKAVYTCKDGFVLKGQSPRKCLITGYWSGEAPVCIPVTCPYLEDPQYGSVRILSNRVGGKAVYTCKDGFVLKGQSPRKCLITGYWSGEAPVCIPVTCPYLEDPQYGSVKILSNRVGGKAVYTCKDGFVLKGQSPRKCLITGYWSGETPVCIPVTCPYLEDPQYGSVNILSNRVGGKAVYTCKDGFVLKGQSLRKCLITGYWSGEAPVCIPITCPYLDDPQYGSVSIASNRVRGTADYKCDSGYRLVGKSPRVCLITGYWGGQAPVCVPITCPRLDDPKYGSVRVNSKRVGGRAGYQCDAGFELVGVAWRKCLGSGRWSDSAPTCKPLVDCGKPSPMEYGKVKYVSTILNSKAYYTCQSGYVRKGNGFRSCLSNGHWSGTTPVCVREYY